MNILLAGLATARDGGYNQTHLFSKREGIEMADPSDSSLRPQPPF
jgi:hypothetical protein